MYKLAVLTSHPIQYQAPLFQKIAARPEIDLKVYFSWDNRGELDKEFGKNVLWDIPLTEGYKHEFLKNYSPKPSSEFLGQINPGIIRRIKKTSHDAMLVFGWNSLTIWLAFFAAFLRGVPVLLRGENPLNQERLKSGWKIKLKKVILGWLFRHISAFLYIGEENKKFYKFYGVSEEKLFFAPYAVDNNRFMDKANEIKNQKSIRSTSPSAVSPGPNRSELVLSKIKASKIKNDLGIQENAIAILFAGKLIQKKRPMDLLRAFELLAMPHATTPTPYLLFVGDGELRGELEKYALEKKIPNVKFLGFKNQSEIPEIYTVSDILVLPSEAGETWGLVVNEAMCFGVIPIVSDMVGCGPDLVETGVNGYIFPAGDFKQLSEKLSALVNDADKFQRFSETSFQKVKKYSFERDIEALLAALNKL